MVRVNVNCVVDAKKTYLQSFVPKVAPAVISIFRDLAKDAQALYQRKGKSKEELARLKRYIDQPRLALVDLLREVPDWPPSLVQEVVSTFRAESPPYMKLFEKIFLATGVILNTLHSKENAHRPQVMLPEEPDVAHMIVKAVAAELEKDPEILLDQTRGRDLALLVDGAIKAAVLRMIPVEDIAESGDEDDQPVKAAHQTPQSLPDASLAELAKEEEEPGMPPSGQSSPAAAPASPKASPKERSRSRSPSPSPEERKPQIKSVRLGAPADDGW